MRKQFFDMMHFWIIFCLWCNVCMVYASKDVRIETQLTDTHTVYKGPQHHFSFYTPCIEHKNHDIVMHTVHGTVHHLATNKPYDIWADHLNIHMPIRQLFLQGAARVTCALWRIQGSHILWTMHDNCIKSAEKNIIHHGPWTVQSQGFAHRMTQKMWVLYGPWTSYNAHHRIYLKGQTPLNVYDESRIKGDHTYGIHKYFRFYAQDVSSQTKKEPKDHKTRIHFRGFHGFFPQKGWDFITSYATLDGQSLRCEKNSMFFDDSFSLLYKQPFSITSLNKKSIESYSGEGVLLNGQNFMYFQQMQGKYTSLTSSFLVKKTYGQYKEWFFSAPQIQLLWKKNEPYKLLCTDVLCHKNNLSLSAETMMINNDTVHALPSARNHVIYMP